jgi:deoxyribose-phosphate aldolase
MDFEKYGKGSSAEIISAKIESLKKNTGQYKTSEILKLLFSCIDLTTLSTEDNDTKIISMCNRVNEFTGAYSYMQNVAAICVYPSFVKTVKRHLEHGKASIASVAGGFPSSQTFLEIKVMEAEMAVQTGANEIDMVISVGKFFDQDYDTVAGEIRAVKEAIGKAHLKVILETGLLKSLEYIRLASLISLEAGADFIKTSTGKTETSATPEAAYVMAEAIRDYYKQTGFAAGLKPSGGILTSEEALIYYQVMREVLGEAWIIPGRFRLGASRLANNILSDIEQFENPGGQFSPYF